MTAALYDYINLLKKASPIKLLNSFMVLASYGYSRITGKVSHVGKPVSVSIEPTTFCNLRCPECPSGLRAFHRPTGMLEQTLFESAVAQLKKRLWYLTFYFQGEPFLHPKFLEYVRYASSQNIYTATSTNAHYLSEERAKQTVESGLDRLIISIDGTSQDTYTSYRIGGNLDKVIEGTRNIVRWKKELDSKKPFVIFQFLVVRQNEHQVEEVKKLARDLGVDKVVFKTAQIYDYENGSGLLPHNEKYSRYRKNGSGKYEIKNPLLNHCWKMWQGCVITWDGKVVPCCFDKDGDHAMGTLAETSFDEIWNGKSYSNFRRAILKGRDQIDICKNCTEGAKVFA